MPKQVVSTVYQYSELSEQAKEKAREWYREGASDYEWWDATYEDAKTIGKFLGWEIDKIYFSGFSSQGDGACFEGNWLPGNVNVEGLEEYVTDDELSRIGKDFAKLVNALSLNRKLARLEGNAFDESPGASVRNKGYYSHSGCTNFQVSDMDGEQEHALIDASRALMDWIYRQLEKEYDWLNADEQVAESIIANEYDFDEDGNRA